MTVVIVKPGKIPQPQVYRVQCPSCSALLDYMREDISFRYSTIECGFCKKPISVHIRITVEEWKKSSVDRGGYL